MTVDEITRRLEQLDSALRLVETEGRDLEEKIRKGTTVTHIQLPFLALHNPQQAVLCFSTYQFYVFCL